MVVRWFPEHQTAIATTIGSLAPPIGTILAMMLGPKFVHKDEEDGGKIDME